MRQKRDTYGRNVAHHDRERRRKVKALRVYRERAGLSIETLSKAAGVATKTIWKTEMGLNSPSIRTLERMVVPLGVSIVDVLAAEDVLSLSGQRDGEKAK